MELKDVERIEALASDPHVVMPTAWQGFYLHTANAWTRNYVSALLAAAPELLLAARQGIIAMEEIRTSTQHCMRMIANRSDFHVTETWAARMVECDRLYDCITGTPEDREKQHRARAQELRA